MIIFIPCQNSSCAPSDKNKLSHNTRFTDNSFVIRKSHVCITWNQQHPKPIYSDERITSIFCQLHAYIHKLTYKTRKISVFRCLSHLYSFWGINIRYQIQFIVEYYYLRVTYFCSISEMESTHIHERNELNEKTNTNEAETRQTHTQKAMPDRWWWKKNKKKTPRVFETKLPENLSCFDMMIIFSVGIGCFRLVDVVLCVHWMESHYGVCIFGEESTFFDENKAITETTTTIVEQQLQEWRRYDE